MDVDVDNVVVACNKASVKPPRGRVWDPAGVFVLDCCLKVYCTTWLFMLLSPVELGATWRVLRSCFGCCVVFDFDPFILSG